MTCDEWRDKMREHGFSFRCITQAKEAGEPRKAYPSINVWSVYGPEGDLLTSCVTREVSFKGTPDVLFIFWINDSNSIDDDVGYLKALDDQVRRANV